MIQSPRSQGPGKGIFDTLRRVAAIVVSMVETRIRLIAVELEENTATLVQLLLLIGFTLLFAAFGLMCLLILIFWAIDPVYRAIAMAITAGILLILAVFSAIWTIRKTRKLTFFNSTREQLRIDRKMLEDDHHE
ncbi:phage holin family protein [Xenorhabdus bovienii]|uniref:Inner membrane protein yqjE n=1 Tax=Xenorhabdus bovienii str. Intermedium TaxID=1379677 RepID=A0A077QGX0_XENBV|nr:phage holin family protein [Xenorhabdus bovienii]MDE9432926.1 phage holin family protein [Xenorhabdus bovienii]MDE9452627.1 phage holin family protein [Xenorhabdus bovienii]MDE9490702.1 phage holin family protein [Xenorhabdus bovienii]MDE9506846.1 phage holin family protein [Xenorhabdus bovienii]MDE9547650.1 phage holin family protein [Xenorhabdus bovienii]